MLPLPGFRSRVFNGLTLISGKALENLIVDVDNVSAVLVQGEVQVLADLIKARSRNPAGVDLIAFDGLLTEGRVQFTPVDGS